MLILCGFIVATVLLLVAYKMPALKHFKQLYDLARIVPGPSIFEFPLAIWRGRNLEFIAECNAKYGKVFRIWIGFDVLVVFCDPEDAKTILSSNDLLDKSSNYELTEIWIGKGLLTNNGADWRLKRKLATPSFNYQLLNTFRATMVECCDILVNRLKAAADRRRPINLYEYTSLYALDVICETSVGVKVNAQLNEKSEHVEMTRLVTFFIQRRIVGLWQRIGFLYNRSAEKKKLEYALHVLQTWTWNAISYRRGLLDADTAVESTDDLHAKVRRPFLDSLLVSQRETGSYTDQNLREEVDSIIFGGHDTLTVSIATTIFMLAAHPEVQRKVFAEITASDGNDDVQSCAYLDAVIKETLRLYPPVPNFSRQASKPIQIGKYTIPPRVALSVNVSRIHRQPDNFPDPDTFRPERFAKDGDAAAIHPFAYIPFSSGPRNCMGQKYALLELRVTLVRLLREFEFTPVDGFKPQFAIELVLRSFNGLMVNVHRRGAVP